MLEGPNTGGIGGLLNMQLDEVLEGPDNGDVGSLLSLQLILFSEFFLLLNKVGGLERNTHTAQPTR